MANWLRRAGRYRELFDKALARHGLPRDLVYLAMIESGFENAARSRVGAGGIWQFMPGAARAYGLEVSYWVDARRDPERAADAAARYLKDLYVRFGSWHLVFAAYNAGYGAVLRSITNYNTNDYWELVKHESGLPWESSVYVPKILAAAIVGRNQAAFGFADVDARPPFAYEEVEVPAGTTLATVARAAGAKPEVIEALNPQLLREPHAARSRARRACACRRGRRRVYAANIDKARAARQGGHRACCASARRWTTSRARAASRCASSAASTASRTRPSCAPGRRDRRAAEADGAGDKAKDKDGDKDDDDARKRRRAARRRRRPSWSRFPSVRSATKGASASSTGRATATAWTRSPTRSACAARSSSSGTTSIRAPSCTRAWCCRSSCARTSTAPASCCWIRRKVRVVTLGLGGVPGARDRAAREEAPLLHGEERATRWPSSGRRYGLTPGDLARINRFSYNTELHEGDRVVVYSPTGEAPREEHAWG